MLRALDEKATGEEDERKENHHMERKNVVRLDATTSSHLYHLLRYGTEVVLPGVAVLCNGSS